MRTRMARWTVGSLILGSLFLPMAALGQNETNHGPATDTPADGRGNLIRQLPPRSQAGTGGAVVQGNGISYHNGPVMRNGVNIYYIWYGNWANNPLANSILTDFANNIGGSPYFNINTTYGDNNGNVPNTAATIKYVASTTDAGSLGTTLSDSSIWTLVTNSLNSGAFPVDPNGMYFVLTAPFVAESSGFLSSYCGWHTYNNYGANSTPIKYSFVGHPAASLGSCAAQSTSPNGDAGADGMASVIAHELEETASDPQLNAWSDSTGAENADKCAWTFGTTYTANGAAANMKLGTRDFLIQRNWVNAGGGSCALSYSAVPDFSLSVSPTSQTVSAGGTTGNYTVAATAVNGWGGSVTYSVTTGLPTGASALVVGNVVTISTLASTPGGTFNFTISGTDGTNTHTIQAALVVTAPDFSLSVAPTSQTVAQGGTTGNYSLTATALNGWSGSVTYSVTAGLPAGATALVTGNLITISTLASTPGGTFNFTISGTDGTHTHTIQAALVVTVPTFNLSISPTSLTASRPSVNTFTVTVSPNSGYTKTVNLTASGGGAGMTLALSPTSIAGGNGTSTFTVTLASNAKKGNSTLTVTAKDGTLSKSVSVTLRVN